MIQIDKIDKSKEGYEDLLNQSKNLVDPALDGFTNICAILSLAKYRLDLFWVGIYIVNGNKLLLGPFQGMPACTQITMGKGVCGTAASDQKIQIVPDVNEFEGYIACHSETRSEIVIPAVKDGKCMFVLDIDSTEADYFNETDAFYLQKLTDLMLNLIA
jgi:L-methionine (R)-S-oxide reductase